MKLEVGMYVRYTRGMINGYVPLRIARITDCEDNELIKIDKGQVILRSDVIKASHELIDLIEVGDYVNGKEVTYVYPNLIKVDSTDIWEIYSCDIKSIVTKEQFNSVRYEVK